jgi:hypothetical protein
VTVEAVGLVATVVGGLLLLVVLVVLVRSLPDLARYWRVRRM